MNDPYKVLGVSHDATDEEIKKAYRNLARKYHPDNYVNNPLADLVEEKMKEINEAYDTIQKQRAQGSSTASSSSSGNVSFSQIRVLINQGRFSEAGTYLDYVPVSERNAEWNFLKGCILAKRGYYYDAQKYYETACYLDPENAEYSDALNKFKNINASRNSTYQTSSASSCDTCSICQGLICADCCCECMGGDLIRCC
ncbi:MAG: J domain-containing protein [Ruminococcaceae bacterium]|nr:J domain-containing protein [Oscillospiraceae bacterium]